MKTIFQTLFSSTFIVLSLSGCASSNREIASLQANGDFPLLERLAAREHQFEKETLSWLKKWQSLDLDDKTIVVTSAGPKERILLDELSGSTSVNLKVKKYDEAEQKYKSLGTFVTKNSAANPNTEVAYFNLAALLGYEKYFRMAIPYDLGPLATEIFAKLIRNAKITHAARLENKNKILAAISQNPNSLVGCMKAGKPDSESAIDTIKAYAVNSRHPLLQFLQATATKPKAGEKITLMKGYAGDALALSRQLSILMTFDAIFQQWDRYSGGNLSIAKDEQGNAYFYSSDNGGAHFSKTTTWVEKNLSWFSRYDRNLVEKLRALNAFLQKPSIGYLGYTDLNSFVVDLGLRTDLKPEVYADRLKRNLELVLNTVDKNTQTFGQNAFLD